MSPIVMPPAAVPAWVALHRVLFDLPRPVPCQVDGEPFTSDDKAERADAAEACRTACPAIAACGRYAASAGETDHVWGGIDRTVTSRSHQRRTGVAA